MSSCYSCSTGKRAKPFQFPPKATVTVPAQSQHIFASDKCLRQCRQRLSPGQITMVGLMCCPHELAGAETSTHCAQLGSHNAAPSTVPLLQPYPATTPCASHVLWEGLLSPQQLSRPTHIWLLTKNPLQGQKAGGDNSWGCSHLTLGAHSQRHICYSYLRACKKPPRSKPGGGTPEPGMVTSHCCPSNSPRRDSLPQSHHLPAHS